MSAEIPQLTGFFQARNVIRAFDKGYLICSQDQPFESVFMVKSGMVKMFDLDQNGLERTISIFTRQNVFPLIWLLNEPPETHLYFYEAYTDTECYIAQKVDLSDFSRQNPLTLLDILDGLTKSYLNLAARLRNLERSQVKERLEFVLYVLAVDLGKFKGSVAEIETTITQDDISKLAGVTRESISLEMSQSTDLIWKSGRRTYIDTSKIDSSDLPAILNQLPV